MMKIPVNGPCTEITTKTRIGIAVRTGYMDFEAGSLKEAIRAYEQKYDVSITPYDGSYSEVDIGSPPRYFFHVTNADQQRILVDIHIEHVNGSSSCVKQNLAYELEPGDKISIGELVC